MNRFEDAIARELTRRLRVGTRRVQVLARWAAAAVPPGALVDDAVRLVVGAAGERRPEELASQVMAEAPDRFGRNWRSGPAH